MQLYWWQRLGVYLCGAYDADSGVMAPLGRFVELEAAIRCALAA